MEGLEETKMEWEVAMDRLRSQTRNGKNLKVQESEVHENKLTKSVKENFNLRWK